MQRKVKKMVSVIVPVFNAEKKVEKCIESILNQTYQDIELILIDDGSLDESAEICRKYEQKDSRVRFFYQQNCGVSAARNRGVSIAKGEYIQFVDSDDYISPYMSEKLVASIERTNADIVICGFTEVFEHSDEERLPDIQGLVLLEKLNQVYPEIFEKFLLNSPCNKLYRKDKIIELFSEDISLGEDLIFNLHNLKKMETIFFLRESLYYYIINSGSLNRKYRRDSIECAERLYIESIDFSRTFKIGQEAEKNISSIFITFLFYGLSDIFAISDYDKKTKKQVLQRWVYNENVQMAAQCAAVEKSYRKIALFMTKYKMIGGLRLLFTFRGMVRRKISKG